MTSAQPDPFLALADPTRRQMLHLLSRDSLTINGLAENFDMSRPAISKHVKMLHDTGFIDIRDIGRERYCTLRPEGFDRLKEWVAYFDQFWAGRLKELEKALNEKAAGKARIE